MKKRLLLNIKEFEQKLRDMERLTPCVASAHAAPG